MTAFVALRSCLRTARDVRVHSESEELVSRPRAGIDIAGEFQVKDRGQCGEYQAMLDQPETRVRSKMDEGRSRGEHRGVTGNTYVINSRININDMSVNGHNMIR